MISLALILMASTLDSIELSATCLEDRACFELEVAARDRLSHSWERFPENVREMCIVRAGDHQSFRQLEACLIIERMNTNSERSAPMPATINLRPASDEGDRNAN